MALRTLFSQTYYVDETYVRQENGDTTTQSSKNNLPEKEILSDEKYYCFKNTKPTETRMYLEDFNPNGAPQRTEQEINGKKIAQYTIKKGNNYTKPLSNKIIEDLKNQGNYLVLTFSPNDREVEWRSKPHGGEYSDVKPHKGSAWLCIKKIQSKKIILDTNIYNNKMPFIDAVLQMLGQKNTADGINFSFEITIDGMLYIYSYPDDTQNNIEITATQSSITFIPKRDIKIARYAEVNSKLRTKPTERRLQNRATITETQDGFWKVVTENFRIKVKMSIEGWGIMGGPFGNWLVDSGFKTVEEFYTYERDGKTVNALTITTPHPTKQVGKWDPGIGPIWYTGKLMTLARGDIVNVWYTETEWNLANSIYAKNFTTDLQQTFDITSKWESFLFRQNKAGDLGKIVNHPGMSRLRFKNGGFGQIDSSKYTGLAVYLRFEVINPEYKTAWEIKVPKSDPFYDSFSAVDVPAWREDPSDENAIIVVGNGTLVHSGFMSGYPKIEKAFDASITYTALLPSDPEFTTGGWEYNESITAPLYNDLRTLTNQVNEFIAKNNISDITSSVMSVFSLATSFPSMFSGVVDALKSAVSFLKKVKKNKPKVALPRIKIGKTRGYSVDDLNITTPTLLTSVTRNTPDPIFSNILSDDELFTALHGVSNAVRKQSVGRNEIIESITETIPLDPNVTARLAYSTPPVLTRKNAIKKKHIETLREKIPQIDDAEIVEFNQIRNTVSTINNRGIIASYAINEDLLDEIISQMGNGHARTLFSLQMRKRIIESKKKDGMVKWDTNKIFLDLLNDKELFDVTGGLTTELTIELWNEFAQLLHNALSV
ncbi:VP4 [Rotavirus J]|uniref:VP4 n=1 Tax=Rotavirus J TaxID=1929964 RepID=A0A1L6BXL3_9REOV|nr:VP4 [Rotavirus J]APQ41756.1 VP4 [Rotavirus J]